jgi:endoglucanase
VIEVIVTTPFLPAHEHQAPHTKTTDWKVNGKNPLRVHRYSLPADEQKEQDGRLPVSVEHRLYLELPDELKSGSNYSVTGPYGAFDLAFDDRQTPCEAIKVNQVGYNARSESRYANFGVFLGDGGSKKYERVDYNVVHRDSGEVIFSGQGRYIRDDTNVQMPGASGEQVYRLSLSKVPAGGPYYISVPGCGRSPAFGIGQKYSEKIARVFARGLYHQRCGMALEEPYTKHVRPACHTKVAHTHTYDQEWIRVPEGARMHDIRGGYHDAGDFDRRPQHAIIPILLLSYYEAFPEHFVDSQYSIPESGNGIPDLLDEALWALTAWRHLQVTDPKHSHYGGVMGGTETERHPVYGRESAANDTLKYGTWAVSREVTALSAGFFAQAARLIEPFDKKLSDELTRQAQLAWDYLERKRATEGARTDIMYAALQLYLLQNGEKHHSVFENAARKIILEGGTWPEQYLPGNSMAQCQTAHFVSYVLSPKAKSDLAGSLRQAILAQAEKGGYLESSPLDTPYAQGATHFTGWGATTAQGRYADPYCFAYRLSDDPSQRQRYFNIVSQYADYALGLNPLGVSFVTGLGEKQVKSPLHLDSYFTRLGLSDGVNQAHEGKPKGNVPGILVYGPAGRSDMPYQRAVSDLVYPDWDKLPTQRQWADGWSLVNGNEFSVWETMVWGAVLHGFLYNASGASGEGEQNARPLSQTDLPGEPSTLPTEELIRSRRGCGGCAVSSQKHGSLSWTHILALAACGVAVKRRKVGKKRPHEG